MRVHGLYGEYHLKRDANRAWLNPSFHTIQLKYVGVQAEKGSINNHGLHQIRSAQYAHA